MQWPGLVDCNGSALIECSWSAILAEDGVEGKRGGLHVKDVEAADDWKSLCQGCTSMGLNKSQRTKDKRCCGL
jgi:hypothetical protein